MKKSKFNNKKVIFQGIKFDSILEMNCYKVLKKICLEKNLKLLLQVSYNLTGRYRYIADFVITSSEIDKELIIDAKGVRTPIFNLKSELMKSKFNKIVYCAECPSQAKRIVEKYIKNG